MFNVSTSARDTELRTERYLIANSTRLPTLKRRVEDWSSTLITPSGGALSFPVPNSRSAIPEASGNVNLPPRYVRTPEFISSQSNRVSDYISLVAPPGSIILQTQNLPSANLSSPFSEPQSIAIISALTPQTIARFGNLPDDRQKVLARTLLVIALGELQKGTLQPKEFAYVVGEILRVSQTAILPAVQSAKKRDVPGATPLPNSGSQKGAKRPAIIPGATSASKEPKQVAKNFIDRKAVTLSLSSKQTQELIKILIASWKLEIRAGTTTFNFENYLKNSKPSQWADWVNSAKDVGLQDEQETWATELLPFVGNRASLIADIRKAFPNEPAMRRKLAQLVTEGLSLQQGIARLKGSTLTYSQIRTSGDQIVIRSDKTPTRNVNSVGPVKLHKEFPIQLANLLDAMSPMPWFAIKNSAGNWSIRIREKIGAPYQPFATVKVPTKDSGNQVFVVQFTQELTPTEKVVRRRLTPESINYLNARFGTGKWAAREESMVSVGIMVADVRQGYIATRSGEKQQFIAAKSIDQTRVAKTSITSEQITKVNALAGSEDWYLRKESPNRLVAVMPRSGRFVARFYPDGPTNPKNYRLEAVTLGKPQDGTHAGLPKEIVALCDSAFGEGNYRANFVRPGYFHVLSKVHVTSLNQSSYLGSLTLKPDPRTGIDTWVLHKATR
jgi:hypothetical protein